MKTGYCFGCGRTRDEIVDMLQKAGVPCGPIHSVADALGSPQAQARGAVVEMTDPETSRGALNLLGNPLKLSKTPVKYNSPPPRFGAHTKLLSNLLDQHRRQRRSR